MDIHMIHMIFTSFPSGSSLPMWGTLSCAFSVAQCALAGSHVDGFSQPRNLRVETEVLHLSQHARASIMNSNPIISFVGVLSSVGPIVSMCCH